MSCYHPEDGGFGASPRNDSHLLSTLSALQILALLDALGSADTDAVAACEGGSCSGWG
jgi:geranylgeranyl transferase type-2 subunit beta